MKKSAIVLAVALATSVAFAADTGKSEPGKIDDIMLMRFWVGNKVVDHLELDFGNSNFAVYQYSGTAPQPWLDYALFKPLTFGDAKAGRAKLCITSGTTTAIQLAEPTLGAWVHPVLTYGRLKWSGTLYGLETSGKTSLFLPNTRLVYSIGHGEFGAELTGSEVVGGARWKQRQGITGAYTLSSVDSFRLSAMWGNGIREVRLFATHKFH